MKFWTSLIVFILTALFFIYHGFVSQDTHLMTLNGFAATYMILMLERDGAE